MLFCAKIPFIVLREAPVIFKDEAFYLHKARVIFDYLSFSAPRPKIDIDTVYLSAYSIYLAVSNIFETPHYSYRFALILNALVLSSIIFPAFKIAEKEFYTKRYIISLLVGIWSVPFTDSFAAMSEALFIPLIVWFGYFYLCLTQKNSLKNQIGLIVVLTLLIMTRMAGIILIPAMILVLVLRKESRFGFAKLTDILRRIHIVLIPLTIWILFKDIGGNTGGQDLERYTQDGILIFLKSYQNILVYLKIWLGQIAYLNIATLFLFSLCFCFPLKQFPPSLSSENQNFLPLRYFIIIICIAMIFPGTIHMFMAKTAGRDFPRYSMYGRYADMVVPFIIIFCVGVMSDYKNKFSRQSLINFILFLLPTALTLLFLNSEISILGDIHVVNKGTGWCMGILDPNNISIIFILAVPVYSALVLFSFAHRNVMYFLLIPAFIFIQFWNDYMVIHVLRYYDALNYPLFKQLNEIRQNDGILYYRSPDDSRKIYYKAIYFLHDKMLPYSDNIQIDRTKDYIIQNHTIVSFKELTEESE